MSAKLRDLHWTFPALAAFLGALGGWSWKWLRRYALPITGGLLAMAYGIPRPRCVRYAVATTLAFSLPYSPDRQSWLIIFLVGASYGATPLLLGSGLRWVSGMIPYPAPRSLGRLLWPALTGCTLVGLLQLSAAAPWWTHKWTEMVIFGLHGFLVSWTIDKRLAHGQP